MSASTSKAQYLSTLSSQRTDWLEFSAAYPSPYMSGIHVALHLVELRRRGALTKALQDHCRVNTMQTQTHTGTTASTNTITPTEQQRYTVRANRGKPRIWIEGKRLSAAGFKAKATRYTITRTDNSVTITANIDGERRVSGKAEKPIIDISGKGCAPFVTGDDVVITYTANTITIQRA